MLMVHIQNNHSGVNSSHNLCLNSRSLFEPKTLKPKPFILNPKPEIPACTLKVGFEDDLL